MINIIAPLQEEWILHKLARKVGEIDGVKLSEKPDPKADINYFINWALYEPVDTKTIGWFTHPENKDFYKVAREMDWCICHAEQYAKKLRKIGCRATTITPGIDDIFKPKLRLGVVGKRYDGKRKGGIIIEAVEELDFVELKFTHNSWGGDDIPFKELPDFYNSIDYLLVPALLEGGPIPVGEAIKCGKKVIAPIGLGNIEIYSKIIHYKRGDIKDLIKTIKYLYEERTLIAETVEKLTWDNFKKQHQTIFNYVK